MKTRLNLTIEESVLATIKNYAESNDISISELVETYFKKLTRPARRKNIIDLVEKLEKPGIENNADLKELFYKANAEKYGF